MAMRSSSAVSTGFVKIYQLLGFPAPHGRCNLQALQFVVNHREEPKQPPKVSERLNRYIDSLLRKSLKSQNEAELENALSRAVTSVNEAYARIGLV